jgi:hypothetical protein
MMGLTKNQFVLKAVVEDMLRRNYNEPKEKADIQTGLNVMNAIIPKGRLIVMATAPRFAQDFANVMGRSINQLWYIAHADRAREAVCGQEGLHIVQLHTGMLTIEQSAIRKDIHQAIQAYCRNAVIWHVGDWRG